MKKYTHRHTPQSTTIAQSTIDTILTHGASRLYDHYIQTKIPQNVTNTYEKIIQNVLNPMLGTQGQGTSAINRIHESFSQKIDIVQQKKKSSSHLDFQGKNLIRGLAKTLQADKKRSRNGIKDTVKKKCHERTRQSKEPSKCIPNPSDGCNWFDRSEQLQQKWSERGQRFNQQLRNEQQQRQTNYKSARLRKQLENQLRQLYENNKTITFNHHTGRLFHMDQHHDYSREADKLHLINIKFALTHETNLPKEEQTEIKCSMVRTSRKITSFERNRRKINFIDDEADDSNYNNNGKRQTTNIPFIEIQEGVSFFEGKTMNTIDTANSNRKTRINSASLTNRTFKSYTKQKMESSRAYRSIATASSATKTRYLNRGETDQKKLQNCVKSSILWSKHGEPKNHKIIRNQQLVGNFLDWTQQ